LPRKRRLVKPRIPKYHSDGVATDYNVVFDHDFAKDPDEQIFGVVEVVFEREFKYEPPVAGYLGSCAECGHALVAVSGGFICCTGNPQHCDRFGR